MDAAQKWGYRGAIHWSVESMDHEPRLKRYRRDGTSSSFFDFERGYGIMTDPLTFKRTPKAAWRSFLHWKARELSRKRAAVAKAEVAVAIAKKALSRPQHKKEGGTQPSRAEAGRRD